MSDDIKRGSVVKQHYESPTGRLYCTIGIAVNDEGFMLTPTGFRLEHAASLGHTPTHKEKIADLPVEAVDYWQNHLLDYMYRSANIIEECWGLGGCKELVAERLQEANAKWTPSGWSVCGDISLSLLALESLPKFDTVTGNFLCDGNPLKSLIGSPSIVGGQFSCIGTGIVDLEGGPQQVGKSYYCSMNRLKSLKGAPEEVPLFNCEGCHLTSLEGSPKKVEIFECPFNNLTSLQGCPDIIEKYCVCLGNPLQECHLDSTKVWVDCNEPSPAEEQESL